MFADDIVLLADTPENMQCLLDELNTWCVKNMMNVNENKSIFVHFRNPSVDRCEYVFKCGYSQIDYALQ